MSKPTQLEPGWLKKDVQRANQRLQQWAAIPGTADVLQFDTQHGQTDNSDKQNIKEPEHE